MSLQVGQTGVCPKDHIQILCCPKLESKSEENLTTQRQQRQAMNVESLQYIGSATYL